MASWKSKDSWPCTAQRLFFPSLLKEVDAVLYLDLDTLILSDLATIWGLFDQMYDKQLSGLSRHSELPGSGYYFRSSKIPYFKPTGLDAGVILMNLTRMRAFKFEDKVIKYRSIYDAKLYLYDQDLLNILFHFYPDRVFILPCSHNFNQGHCEKSDHGAYCKFAEEFGVSILHGTGRSFFKDQAPFFKPIYRVFKEATPEMLKTPQILDELKTSFRTFEAPCFGLNAENFYKPFNSFNKNKRR